MRSTLLAVFAALVGTLLAIPKAEAGCQHVSYQYATPAYVAPTYAVVTPYAVPFAFNAQQYYQVAPELAQLRVNQEIVQAAADAAAKKAVDNFAAALLRQQAVLAQAAPGAVPQVPLATPNATTNQAGSYAEKVQVMVNAKCLSCHNAPNKNKIDLTDVRKLNEVQVHKMEHRVMKDDKDPLMMPRPRQGEKATNIKPDELSDVNAFVDEFTPAHTIPNAPKPHEVPAVPKAPTPGPADKK